MASIFRYGITTLNQALRLIKIILGFTLLLVGIALIFLPGPAFVVIPVSLAILAGEFVWARKLLKKFNDKVNNMKGSRTPPAKGSKTQK